MRQRMSARRRACCLGVKFSCRMAFRHMCVLGVHGWLGAFWRAQGIGAVCWLHVVYRCVLGAHGWTGASGHTQVLGACSWCTWVIQRLFLGSQFESRWVSQRRWMPVAWVHYCSVGGLTTLGPSTLQTA